MSEGVTGARSLPLGSIEVAIHTRSPARPCDHVPSNADVRALGFGMEQVRVAQAQSPSGMPEIPKDETEPMAAPAQVNSASYPQDVPLASVGADFTISKVQNFALAADGWHLGEDWGCWANSHRARLRSWREPESGIGAVALILRPPPYPPGHTFAGGINVDNSAAVFEVLPPGVEPLRIRIAKGLLDGMNELVVSPDLFRPADVDSTSDRRALGFGLLGIEFTPEASCDLECAANSPGKPCVEH